MMLKDTLKYLYEKGKLDQALLKNEKQKTPFIQ